MKSDNFSKSNIIFIGGMPRSGTTLMQNVLDSHTDVYGGPEFDRIPNVIDLYLKFKKSIDKKRIDIYFNQEELQNIFSDFIEAIFMPVSKKQNVKYVSEKTPWNILVFPYLMELIPTSKFIHVTRDPRSVINSALTVHEKSKRKKIKSPDYTKNIYIASKYLLKTYSVSEQLKQKFPNNFIEVKFEELVANSEKIINEICDFLDIPFQEGMLLPGERKHDGEDSMSKDNLWYTKNLYNRNFDKTSIDKWKQELSKSRQYILYNLLREKDTIVNKEYILENVKLNFFLRLYADFKILINKRFLSNYIIDYRVLDNSIYTHYPIVHYILNFFYRKK